jgi:hypothetical protein
MDINPAKPPDFSNQLHPLAALSLFAFQDFARLLRASA